jgi:Zn-dependent M28 family amino/carboxypeptidase
VRIVCGERADGGAGADDDGSGTVNLIEIFRVLMANGFAPATPVEFHWYSGEEAGLLGSQDIAAAYDADGVTVKAFMELDMVRPRPARARPSPLTSSLPV